MRKVHKLLECRKIYGRKKLDVHDFNKLKKVGFIFHGSSDIGSGLVNDLPSGGALSNGELCSAQMMELK